MPPMHSKKKKKEPPSRPRPGSLPTSMDAQGRIMTEAEQKEKWRRTGMCPTCGTVETHKAFLRGTLRVPRTVPHKSYKGKCLNCMSMTQARLALNEPSDVNDLQNQMSMSATDTAPGGYPQDKKTHSEGSKSEGQYVTMLDRKLEAGKDKKTHSEGSKSEGEYITLMDRKLAKQRADDADVQNKLAQIKLRYNKDRWSRIVRATDKKFEWVRLDERGNVDERRERRRFDVDRSAYVLKLDYLNDDGIRRGRLSLVTPEKGVVDSNIRGADGSELASYSDIANAQMKSYNDKINWFRSTCSRLTVTDGKIMIKIRRDSLMYESIQAIMSLSRKELRKKWIFHFMGEDGLDDGGLTREWFELVSKAMFDPNMGLWKMSETNRLCMRINPASAICCPEDHLICFRFIGRMLGRALFDGQLVNGHMVKYLYKHLLRWPVMFNDLRDQDEEYFNSLKQLIDMGTDVRHVGLDFTATKELVGLNRTVDFIPDGAMIEVTEDNLPEYIESCLRYRLLGQCEAQLNELVLGFYDVLPEPLLAIFDFQELELLMCGLPEIEMPEIEMPEIEIDYWMEHTEYSGEFKAEGPDHEICVWFWEIVSEYDREMKARLLQFVTGKSEVPAGGFCCLQGNDGNIRRFTIEGVGLDTCVYPRAHTSFNKIDLPLYKTRKELEEKLKVAARILGTFSPLA